jgi:hypothetical protein
LANREDHPAYGLARGLAGSAAELRSYLSGDFPWSLGYADYAELLPVLEDALDAIAEGITAIHGETHDADETTYMHLSEAAEGTDAASSSLYTVRDWYVKAAREAEARQADRVGRAAETAWTAGAEHGRDATRRPSSTRTKTSTGTARKARPWLPPWASTCHPLMPSSCCRTLMARKWPA